MPPDPRHARLADARSLLFVPGDRADRFDKAIASGADVVVLDLEDAVAPGAKAAAREAVADWLRAGNEAVVRINAAGTPWFDDDLTMVSRCGVVGVMLPKAEIGVALGVVAGLLPTLALIETARGVIDAAAIAAMPGVVRLVFGTIDLALDLDTDADSVLDTIGVGLVVASRAAGCAAPVDGVTVEFRDATMVEAATRAARRRGFGAKLCIHPRQVAPVHAGLRPLADQIDKARRIVAADRTSGGAAVSLDGVMIDRPVVARALRVLAEAGIAAA